MSGYKIGPSRMLYGHGWLVGWLAGDPEIYCAVLTLIRLSLGILYGYDSLSVFLGGNLTKYFTLLDFGRKGRGAAGLA